MDVPKRNSDQLNTIGIVTIGGAGSALVYLSIVWLQAFYVNDTSKVDEQARFGTQGEIRQTLRAEQIGNITESRAMGVAGANNTPVYSIPIRHAMQLIVTDAKVDPGNLVPVVGRSNKSLIQPAFGRPQQLATPPVPAGELAVPPAAGATGTAPTADAVASPPVDAMSPSAAGQGPVPVGGVAPGTATTVPASGGSAEPPPAAHSPGGPGGPR